MMRVVIVDTGHANMTSVTQALVEAGKELNLSVQRTRDPAVLEKADRVVVPGQGGFEHCLQGIRDGVGEALTAVIRRGTPYLGICLGLQALFESSEEAPGVAGLGILKGSNVRLLGGESIKIPHMGWNQLQLVGAGHPVLEALGKTPWVYFVHSYHAQPTDPAVRVALSTHGENEVTAAVAQDNVLATQFHPEKSQETGLKLLRAFLSWG